MRNIFVVNPCAGQGKHIDEFIEKVKATAKALETPVEVYLTKSVGDAEVYARDVACKNKGKEEICFFACGGDGTVNEVANGLVGYENVSMGVVPIGTGNDYVRNYGTLDDFMNLKGQFMGKAQKADLIKYSGKLDGEMKTRYCMNMFNIGFDCNVVDKTAEMKKKPLLSGSFAYLVSVIIILIKKQGTSLKVTIEDKVVHCGPNLLCAIANGSYCGGGVYSSPQAKLDDGIMDVNVVLNLSRINFLKLFPSYSKGTHFQKKNIDSLLHAYPCRRAIIEPLEGTMRLCTDGEIVTAETVELEMAPAAINFVVPAK